MDYGGDSSTPEDSSWNSQPDPTRGAAAVRLPADLLPLDQADADPVRPHPIEIPTLLNSFQFFALAFGIMLVLEVLTIVLARMLPSFHHRDFRAVVLDPRLAIPSQALQYLALVAAAASLFGRVWDRPFWPAIQWNGPAVVRRWMPLLATGLVLGLINGLASNVLPMPKEAPILNDMMRSRTGAWLMLAFGTTLAPLVEELAFRGFLLPSLIHFFHWLGGRNRTAAATPSPQSSSLIIVPASIVLASIPFAMMHSQQVAGAWAPVLLIGIVSVVLCVVRLWTRSLAASTLVHATYNLTLFAGMLIASDGFRHLEKLNN